MRFVQPIVIDGELVFDEISNAKRSPRREQMLSVRQQVVQAYLTYNAAAPEVGVLASIGLTQEQKETMHHAYEVDTQPMVNLRAAILNKVNVTRCPFCSISESSTLDHYLPKERYPEFSILPHNLIPSCSPCNTKKLDRILVAGTNVRMFLHPYFDAIPDLPFLSVQTRMQQNALLMSYSITQPAGMPQDMYQHLLSHFSELDLADRYRRMGLELLGDQYLALRRIYGVNHNGNRVSEKLIEIAEDIEGVRGSNFWLVKMYQALAVNQEFCNGGFEAIRPS